MPLAKGKVFLALQWAGIAFWIITVIFVTFILKAIDMNDLKYYFDNRAGFMRKRSNFHAALSGNPDFDLSKFLTEDSENDKADHANNDDVYEFMVY